MWADNWIMNRLFTDLRRYFGAKARQGSRFLRAKEWGLFTAQLVMKEEEGQKRQTAN